MTLRLPKPQTSDTAPLVEVIAGRRSQRVYGDANISLEQLSSLLWAGQGTTGAEDKRAAPSAGAQYPVELIVVANRIEAVDRGSYRYDCASHQLALRQSMDLRETLYSASIDQQPWVREAACVIAITADFGAMREHFHNQPPTGVRGERYIYIETGSIAQNLHLMGTELGLAMVLVGGFDDAGIAAALQLSDGIQATALMCIGAKA